MFFKKVQKVVYLRVPGVYVFISSICLDLFLLRGGVLATAAQYRSCNVDHAIKPKTLHHGMKEEEDTNHVQRGVSRVILQRVSVRRPILVQHNG